MINLNQLTPDAVHCLDVAVLNARERHNLFLDTEHLILGALESDIVSHALRASSVSAEALQLAISRELSIVRETPLEKLKGIAHPAASVLTRAVDEARQANLNYLNSGHIALAILITPEPFLKDVLGQFPQLDLDTVRQHIRSHSSPPSPTFQQKWRPATWENAYLFAVNGRPTTKGTPRPLTPIQPKRAAQRQGTERNPVPLFAGLMLLVIMVYGYFVRPNITIPVVIVLGGWIVSLVFHEFGHALVAYWGGDYTVVQKGYLTMNPLKYMHPMLSLGLPLLFLIMGGIGLPGGAVYIERHRLRTRWWGAAVSAAGPFANLLCMIVFSIPFWTGYVTPLRFWHNPILWGSLAFLVWLQAIAILFNLLPIPPLDGFGIIEPFLDESTAAQIRSFGSIGLLLVIMMFWIPYSGSGFHPAHEILLQANRIAQNFAVDGYEAAEGWKAFRFWE